MMATSKPKLCPFGTKLDAPRRIRSFTIMYRIIGADGNEYGPITAEQVRQWFGEGRLNAQSKIQVDGSGVWKQLRDMPEFSPLFPPPPPPITLGAPRPPSPTVLPSSNPLAGWALGTGIASMTCCFLPVLSLVSIVLGVLALSQSNRTPDRSGRALAIAGIVLGCISLALGIVFWAIFAMAPHPGQMPSGFNIS
jgi:hypothetical protein